MQDNVGIGTVVRAPIIEDDWYREVNGFLVHDPLRFVEDPDTARQVLGREPRKLEVLAGARTWDGRGVRVVDWVRYVDQATGADNPVEVSAPATPREIAAAIASAHLDVPAGATMSTLDHAESTVRVLAAQIDGADPNALTDEEIQAIIGAWLQVAADAVGSVEDAEYIDDAPALTDPNIRLERSRDISITPQHRRDRAAVRLLVLTRGAVTIEDQVSGVGDIVSVPVPLGDVTWDHAPGRRIGAEGVTTAQGVVVAVVERFTVTGTERQNLSRTVTVQPADPSAG